MIAEALPADPDEPALSKDEYREYLKTTRLEASGMSRIAPPAEKIDATIKVIKELIYGLGLDPEPVVIAQSTEPITAEQLRKATGDLKLIPKGEPEITWRIPPVVMAAVIEAGSRIAMATDTRDMGILGAASPPPTLGVSVAQRRAWGDGPNPTEASVEDVLAGAEEGYS